MIDEDHLRYNGQNEILLTDKEFQKLAQGIPVEVKKAKFERSNKELHMKFKMTANGNKIC